MPGHVQGFVGSQNGNISGTRDAQHGQAGLKSPMGGTGVTGGLMSPIGGTGVMGGLISPIGGTGVIGGLISPIGGTGCAGGKTGNAGMAFIL